MIAIFHLLASIVTWIVIILVSVASLGKSTSYKVYQFCKLKANVCTHADTQIYLIF